MPVTLQSTYVSSQQFMKKFHPIKNTLTLSSVAAMTRKVLVVVLAFIFSTAIIQTGLSATSYFPRDSPYKY